MDNGGGTVDNDTIRWRVPPSQATSTWNRTVRFILPDNQAGCSLCDEPIANKIIATLTDCCDCFVASDSLVAETAIEKPVISVTKNMPDSSTPGDTISAQIAVTLTGPASCVTDIQVEDVFDSRFILIDSGGGTVSGNTIGWTVSGDSAEIGWTRSVRFSLPATYSDCATCDLPLINRITASATDCCSCVLSDSMTVESEINRKQLQISKTMPNGVCLGDTFNVEVALTISDTSGCPIDSIQVYDVFEDFWTLLDAGTGTARNDTIFWSLTEDSLRVHGSTLVWENTLSFIIPDAPFPECCNPGPMLNRIYATGYDCCGSCVPMYDESFVPIEIPVPTINLSKSTPPVAALGDTVTTLINLIITDTTACADTVIVDDVLPSVFEIIDPSGGTVINDTIRWILDIDSDPFIWSDSITYILPEDSTQYCNQEVVNSVSVRAFNVCACSGSASDSSSTLFECSSCDEGEILSSKSVNVTGGPCDPIDYQVIYDFPDGMPSDGSWSGLLFEDFMENEQIYFNDDITVRVVNDAGTSSIQTFTLDRDSLLIDFSDDPPDTSGFPAFTDVDSLIFTYRLRATCNSLSEIFLSRSILKFSFSCGGLDSLIEIEPVNLLDNLGPPEMSMSAQMPDSVYRCDPFRNVITLTRDSDSTAYRPQLFVPLNHYSPQHIDPDSIFYDGILSDTAVMIRYGPVDTTIAGVPGIFWQFNDFPHGLAASGTISIPMFKACDNDSTAFRARLIYFNKCYPYPQCADPGADSVWTSEEPILAGGVSMTLDAWVPNPVIGCQPFDNVITMTRESSETIFRPSLFVGLDYYALQYAEFDSITYSGALSDTATMIIYGPVDTTMTISGNSMRGLYWIFSDFESESPAAGVISIPMLKKCGDPTTEYNARLIYQSGYCLDQVALGCPVDADTSYVAAASQYMSPSLRLVKFPELSFTWNDTAHFDVTIFNESPVTAYNVLVIDSLDVNLSYRAHDLNLVGGVCYQDSVPAYNSDPGYQIQGVSCLIDSIPAFSKAELSVDVNLSGCDLPINYGKFRWGCDSLYCLSGVDDATVDGPSPDLELVNQVSLQNLTSCANDTINVQIRNSGQTVDYNIYFSELLPTGMHYVDGSTTLSFKKNGAPASHIVPNGTGPLADPSVIVTAGGDSILWRLNDYIQDSGGSDSLGTIEPGDIIYIDFVVSADCEFSGGEVQPLARFYSPCKDEIRIGATSSSINSITPVILLDKQPDPFPAQGSISWTVTLRNIGEGATHRLILKDVLPSSITYPGGFGGGGFEPDYLVHGVDRDTLVWIFDDSDGEAIPPESIISFDVDVVASCADSVAANSETNLLFAYYGCADTAAILPEGPDLITPSEIDSLRSDRLFICLFDASQDSLPASIYWEVNGGSDSTLFSIDQDLPSSGYCDTLHTFLFTFVNRDTVTAYPGITIRDDIPAGLYFQSGSLEIIRDGGATSTPSLSQAPVVGQTDSLIWVLDADSLEINDTLRVSVQLYSDCGVAGGDNRLIIYANTCFDSEYEVDSHTEPFITSGGQYDVHLEKRPSIFPGNRNETIEWELVFWNAGTADTAKRVVIIDELPAYIDTLSSGAFSPTSPDSVHGDSLIWIVDAVAPGDSVHITIRGVISTPNCVENSDSNRVWVLTGCPSPSDPNGFVCETAADSAVSHVFYQVGEGYGSLITEFEIPPEIGACDSQFYELRFTNSDSVNAYPDFTASITLIQGITYDDSLLVTFPDGSTISDSTGIMDVISGTSGDTLRWTLSEPDSLAPGDMIRIRFRVYAQSCAALPTDPGTSHINFTMETCAGTVYAARDTSIIVDPGAPVLELEKISTQDSVTTNGLIQYQITLRNTGDGPADSIFIYDYLPNVGYPPVSANKKVNYVVSTGGGSYQDSLVVWDIGSLDPGDSVRLNLELTVQDTVAAGTKLINNIFATQSCCDTIFALQDTLLVIPDLNLEVEKSANPAEQYPGGEVTYSIVVWNLDPTDFSRNVVITDTLSQDVTFLSASDLHDTTTVGSGSNAFTIIVWSLGDLAPQSEKTVTATVRLDSTLVDTLYTQNFPDYFVPNFAIITYTNDDGDTLAPYTATDSTQVVAPKIVVNKSADCCAVNPNCPIPPGDQFTFEISFTNIGNGTADSIVISDVFLGDFVFISNNGFPWAIPLDDATLPPYVIRNLSPGSYRSPLQLTVQIPDTIMFNSHMCNMVRVDTYDENGQSFYIYPDSSHVDTSCVTIVRPYRDIKVEKSATSAEITPGGLITYHLNVTNTGNQPLIHVVIRDSLVGSGLTYHSSNFDTTRVDSIGYLVWAIRDSLLPGDSEEIRVSLLAAADPDSIDSPFINIANVQAVTAHDTTDHLGDQDNEVLPVGSGGPAYEIDKVAVTAVVGSGNAAEYLITIRNIGNSLIRHLVVRDTLPEGITVNPFLISNPPPDSVTYNQRAIHWSIDSLAVGSTFQISFTGLAADTLAGLYNNVVTLVGENISGDSLSVISDSAWVVVTGTAPGITLSKIAFDNEFTSGQDQ
ncbi:MAG: hypothetical protein B6244_00805, partial [Candidatus Cloacimonetes bacterium 4572_55]